MLPDSKTPPISIYKIKPSPLAHHPNNKIMSMLRHLPLKKPQTLESCHSLSSKKKDLLADTHIDSQILKVKNPPPSKACQEL
jgi:hypothetical protein